MAIASGDVGMDYKKMADMHGVYAAMVIFLDHKKIYTAMETSDFRTRT